LASAAVRTGVSACAYYRVVDGESQLLIVRARMKPVLRAFCLVLLALAGCDDEASERRAFIDFLQEHIVARPGVHLVLMKPDMAKSFGRYASQYQPILDFHANLDLHPLESVARLKGQISDLSDLVAHRGELKTLRDAVPNMIATVEQKLAAIDAAHAAMQQPADLKEVYDKAYDRLVTRPATLMLKMLRLMPSSLDAMMALADYAADNVKDIRVRGMGGTSDDPVVERHIQELAEAMHRNDGAVDELKRQLQALLNGT
jgi:hypothetical protein